MRIRSAFPMAAGSSRLALGVVLASLCTGCSSDMLRFNDDPFTNPFSNSRDATGSIRRTAPKTVPSAPQPAYRSPARVSAAPLPAPGTPAMGRLSPRSAPLTTGSISPRAVSAVAAQRTGTLAATSAPGWSTRGGTPVTLGQGESVESVANRYGVPAPILLNVNGLASSSQATPGQRLVIPTFNATSRTVPDLKARALALNGHIDAPLVIAHAPIHYALSGEVDGDARVEIGALPALAFASDTDSGGKTSPKKVRSFDSIAAPISIKPPAYVALPKSEPRPPKPVATATRPAKPLASAKPGKILAANPPKVKPAATTTLASVGHPPKLAAKTPVARKIAAAPAAKVQSKVVASAAIKPATKSSKTAQAKPKPSDKKTTVAQAKPAQKLAAVPVVPVVRPSAKTETPPSEVSAYASDATATGSLPSGVAGVPSGDQGVFRWPARGRVISSFGSKDVAGTNNGINISMPEGTPIKAAEAGTVAYSGDDVKKYGKLVLIKHDNGYVSAYAHNGELDVKKGEIVKRGQIIAKSGVTGDVTSPQLHFQLRRGEQPIDPIKLLDTN